MTASELREANERNKRRAFWLLVFLFLAFFIALPYWAYTRMQSLGWASYTQDAFITVGSNWIVGETQTCSSLPLDASNANIQGKPMGYAVYSLFCDDGPLHSVKVAFYGAEVQLQYQIVFWRCTRNPMSSPDDAVFTCKETGGK